MVVVLPNTIAVITTLNPVGPRTKIDAQWFSVHFSLAFDGLAQATTPTNPPATLLPWTTPPTRLQLVVREETSAAAVSVWSKEIPLPGSPLRGPLLQPGKDAACQGWLQNQSYQLAFIPGRDSEVDDPAVAHDLHSAMGFLSTFSGAVPQTLFLTDFFKLALAQGKSWHQNAKYSILVVPESGTWTADIAAFIPAWQANPDAWTAGVDYTAGSVKAYPNAIDFEVTAYNEVKFDGEPDGTNLGLNFKDYWCTSKIAFPWASNQHELCERSVNLPALIDEFITDKSSTVRQELQYRSMARFSQWEDPRTAGAGTTTATLLSKIDQIPGIDKAEYKARLQKFYGNLINSATAQSTWDKMLKTEFVNCDAIKLASDPRSGQFFAAHLLLAQWDYAITQEEVNIPSGAANDPAVAWRQVISAAWPPSDSDQLGVIDEFYNLSSHILSGSLTGLPANFKLHGPEHCEQYLLTEIDNWNHTDPKVQLDAIKVLLADWLKDEQSALFDPANPILPNIPIPDIPDQSTNPAGNIAFDKAWKIFVDNSFVGNYIEPLNPGLEKKPGGLSIQVDNFASQPVTDKGPDPDEASWRRIAGLGLIVKEDPGTWRICTAASVYDNTNTPPDPIFQQPAIVPVRIPYKGAHRVPILDYNQRSLVSKSPLEQAVEDDYHISPNESSGITSADLYSFEPATGVDRLLLTRLKFGRKYKMAAFMIDSAGGLPTELTENNVPWQFKYDFTDGDIAGLEAPGKQVVVPFTYWRRTAISAPRLISSKDQTWPALPDDVSPIAREIDGDIRDSEAPLALLGDESFNLSLRPASVDVDTIERWLPNHSASDKDHIKQVLIDNYMSISSKNSLRKDPLVPVDDFSLDDPAVDAHLVLVDSFDFGSNSWQTVIGARHQVPSPLPGSVGAKRHQSPSMEFAVKQADIKTISYQPSGLQNVEISVPIGMVVRIRAFSLVQRRLIEGQPGSTGFAKIASKVFDETSESGSGGWTTQSVNDIWFGNVNLAGRDALQIEIKDEVFVSRTSVLIESPSYALPTGNEIWKVLEVTDLDEDLIEVSCNSGPTIPAGSIQRRFWCSGAWRNVARCEIVKQTWRWQGTRVSPPLMDDGISWPNKRNDVATTFWQKTTCLPNWKGGNPELDFADLLLWEKIAFENLHDKYDSLVIPIPFLSSVDSVASQPIKSATFLDDFKNEKRAQYVRYGMRVISRYAGLMKGQRAFQESEEYVLLDDGGKSVEYQMPGLGWKRVFIPYRGQRPSKPVIKALIPLTASPEYFLNDSSLQQPSASPLLVVLEEQAFKECGISESITIQLEVAQGSELVGGVPNELYQVGSDPILESNGTIYKPDASDTSSPLRGPYGHSYDLDSRQPLYSASSYLIPRILLQQGLSPVNISQPWTFAKVMLRRLSGKKTIDESIVNAEINEVFTKPVWIQFLPDRDTIFGEISLAKTVAGYSISINCSQPIPGTPFDFWLLITDKIVDYKGHQESELYRGVVKLTSGGNSLTGTTGGLEFDPNNCRMRIIERQVATIAPLPDAVGTHSIDDDLWWSILGNTENDAPARISRISSPRTPHLLA